MSKVNVNTIEPSTGTDITLGASGDTITVPSGATITNSGTATGFGASLANGANNRVVTATSATALNGESNLTFDGTTLLASEGASGATAHAESDTIVMDSAAAANGLSILSPTSGYGTIAFGDSGDNNIGQIFYEHSNDKMYFYTNAASAMVIDSAGTVTKPLQPYVYAFANANQTLDADDADKTIALNAELKDTNSDFNVSNYTFTAPVTGAYLVNGFYRFTGDTAVQATDWFLRFTASNGAETVWSGNPSVWETSSASAYSKSVNVSKTIYMDASDTLTMTTDVYSGGSYTYVIDGNANSYSATSMQITLLC